MFRVEQSGATLEVGDEATAERTAETWAQVDPWHTVTVTNGEGGSHVI